MTSKTWVLEDKKKKRICMVGKKSDCETLRGAFIATEPERAKNLVIREVKNGKDRIDLAW